MLHAQSMVDEGDFRGLSFPCTQRRVQPDELHARCGSLELACPLFDLGKYLLESRLVSIVESTTAFISGRVEGARLGVRQKEGLVFHDVLICRPGGSEPAYAAFKLPCR
jgi:hypothetical protein